MAAAAWTDVVQQRALEMEVRCVRARRVLLNAAAGLAPAIRAAEAQTARARTQAVLLMLVRAADDLNLASNATTAAELLALRGAAANPTTPLPSIEHIPGFYHDARLALGLFQSARSSAVATCDSAERCYGHLRTASDMLIIAPGLHGLDGVLETHRFFASIYLNAALDSSLLTAALAIVANWLVR